MVKCIAVAKDLQLQAIVARNLVLCGYKKQDVATMLFLSPSAFYKKLSNPSKFTLDEFRRLKQVLKILDAELPQVI